MKIKLNTCMAGPSGSFDIGDTLSVPRDIDQATANALLSSGQAKRVGGEPVVETAEAPPAPENAATAVKKPSPRKRKPRRKK